MSFQEELYDKIEAYLSGELDATEVETFEHEIAMDESLKQAVEKHKIANALIVEQRLLSVKNILHAEKIKDSTSSSYKPLGFIVLAIVSIGVGASLFMLPQKEEVRSGAKKDKLNTEVPTSIGLENTETEHTNNNKSESKSASSDLTHEAQSRDVIAEQNNGFQKHQIQMLENQMGLTKKDITRVDSSTFVVKKQQEEAPLKINENIPTPKSIVAVTPCSNVSIQATINVSPSCTERATGSILVQEIKGGTKPYSIILSSSNNETVHNGEIEKGMYQALITDSKGCSHTYSNISVEEKECPIDYSFNPFYGNEEWHLAPKSVAGKLEIYDKGGVLYFQKTISANTANSWSGMGIGNQVIPGYYIFVINYADGTVKRGSVTIVQ